MDAGGTSRVFDVTSATATVTINGLTISGGNAEDGGGILDQGGAVTLSGNTLANNQVIGLNPGDTVQGGGVEVTDSGSLIVKASTFVNNLAQGSWEPTEGMLRSMAPAATATAAPSTPMSGRA